MWEQDVACVIVVDDSGVRLGVITERDLWMASYFSGLSLKEQTVAVAMQQGRSRVHFREAVAARRAFLRSEADGAAAALVPHVH
jgi:signal-transduction protein with cAMP-binding, CBS, and nucleotidyltransferase domain